MTALIRLGAAWMVAGLACASRDIRVVQPKSQGPGAAETASRQSTADPQATPRGAPKSLNPYMENCMKEATEDAAPRVLMAVTAVSQSGPSRLIKVGISVANLTTSPIWINLTPAALGCGLIKEQQLFVTIHAPWERTGTGWIFECDSPVPADHYRVLEPHKRHDLSVVVDGTG